MSSQLFYLAYVLRHKWHVLVAGWYLEVPLWRLILHDASKFTPIEWGPYVRRFYDPQSKKPASATVGHVRGQRADLAFDAAWEHHWQTNPHHHQFWQVSNPRAKLLLDRVNKPTVFSGQEALPMPETYIREMVADWIGAGKAQGKPDVAAWYQANHSRMNLHEQTRSLATRLIEEARYKGLIP